MNTTAQGKETNESVVQRKSDSDRESEITSETESHIQSLSGGGRPLSRSETEYYEPRFGYSFSDVRIHTGEAADRAARSVNARAFTLGKNIAFADGQYDPSSVPGRTLLAHELTHTLQQSTGPTSVQRGSAGIFGGKCCLPSSGVEWALVGAGVWKKLEQGQCTGTTEDCDGMTCGGGFYHVDNGQTGSCTTPRTDDATFAARRWTPNSAAPNARSPTQEGSAGGDTPPGYVYDSPTYAGCTSAQTTLVESARTTAQGKATSAVAALTALKAGTGTTAQQTAQTAHFGALTAAQFDTAKTTYTTIASRLGNAALFACGSAPAQSYCGPPDNWCAGTVCPTSTGISYLCPNAFTPNCAEPNLWSIMLHEAGRAAGCCPPDTQPSDAGYPPAAPACLTNVYSYSGFARAV